jgi:transcriptional regulator with XRE-family HTH domain
MEALKSDLALNIKKIRKAQGVAQERLALDAEIDRTVVSKIERCVGSLSLDTLLKLATGLTQPCLRFLHPRDYFCGTVTFFLSN